jgi:membrane associated rhomboid family serine protease
MINPEFLIFVILGLTYIILQDKTAILEHLGKVGDAYQSVWLWIRDKSTNIIRDETQVNDAWATNTLISLITASYILALTLGYDAIVSAYSFIPSMAGDAWRWITHIFLHANTPIELAPFSIHLLSNIAFLYWFGDNVEEYLSRVRLTTIKTEINIYAMLFILWGVVAAAAQATAVGWSSTVFMLGASGAISGVLGFYFVKYPNNKVWVGGRGPIPAQLFLGIWFISQFVGGNLSVAYWAHIGGFGAGALSGVFIKAEEE